MNKGTVRIIVAMTFCLWTGVPALAQQVSVEVDRTTVTTDDEIEMTITAEGEYDDLEQPSMPDFEAGSQGQSQQVSIINGRMSRSFVYHLVLTPRKGGDLAIGPARLRRNGQVVAQSQPLTIKVAAISQQPTTQNDALNLSAHDGEAFFLAPTLAQRTIYVGQPVVLGFELYARNDVRVQDFGLRQAPDMAGFSVEDLLGGQTPKPGRRRIGSHGYAVFVLRRALVTPLKSGPVRVGEMTAELIAGDMFSARRYTVRSQPFDLDVRDVPATGRPSEFQEGNLGHFTLTADAQPRAVAVGERVVLTLKIAGTGSVEAVKPPVLPDLPGAQIETLPSQDADQINRTAAGVQGTRVFQYVLTLDKAGTLKIPPIRFAYFDPEAQRFESLATSAIDISVKAAPSGPAVAAATPTAAVAAAGDDVEIRDIRSESDLQSHRPQPLYRSWWFYFLLVGPAVVLCAVEILMAWRRRRERNREAWRSRRALSEALRAVRRVEASAMDGNEPETYANLNQIVAQFCQQRLDLLLTGTTRIELRAALIERAADPQLIEDLQQELDHFDFGRFAPTAVRQEEARKSIARTRQLLDRLNQLAVPHKRQGGAA